MRNNFFFLKIILILLAVISLNIFTRVVINDFFWGNKNLKIKNHLIETNENFNGVFIGSSLTQTQVIPEIIDSISNEFNLKMFNMGASGTKPPETFYYCKYLIKKNKHVKTIFIELIPFIFNLEKEINTEFYYYFNMETQYIYQITNYDRSNKFENYKLAFRNFKTSIKYSLYNLSNIDYFALISTYYSRSYFEDMVRTKYKGMSSSGFCGLKAIEVNEMKFDPETFSKSLAGYRKNSQINQNDISISQTLYLKYVNKINELCTRKGIEIFWVLPPCGLNETYKYTLPIYSQIDNDKKINLADPSKYEYFYDLSIHHDIYHFNIEGAKLYSTAIANEYIALKHSGKYSSLAEN